MPPTCYTDILKAGHLRNRDFKIVIGNRENIGTCLIIAPHGGKIEPMTSQISRAVADVSGRAFYLFDGLLPRNNWGALHISSSCFDEPDFEVLIQDTELVVSFHGAQGDESRNIYVGGLHEEGRALMVEALNPALERFGVVAIDVTTIKSKRSLAGLDRRNLTNRGRKGRGIQFEFSTRARHVFSPVRKSPNTQQAKESLTVLAQTVDDVLQRLTNFPVHEANRAKRS